MSTLVVNKQLYIYIYIYIYYICMYVYIYIYIYIYIYGLLCALSCFNGNNFMGELAPTLSAMLKIVRLVRFLCSSLHCSLTLKKSKCRWVLRQIYFDRSFLIYGSSIALWMNDQTLDLGYYC